MATGVDWRRLERPGVEELLGKGVYYGASTAEAPGLSGRHCVIVGGGNSAGQVAVFFSDWADQVTMVVRGSALSSSMSTYLVDQIESITTIAVRYDASVDRVEGDTWLDRVVITDGDGSSTDVDGGALSSASAGSRAPSGRSVPWPGTRPATSSPDPGEQTARATPPGHWSATRSPWRRPCP